MDNVVSPQKAREQFTRLIDRKEEVEGELERVKQCIDEVESYLNLSDKVTDALESLSKVLFKQLLGVVEDKLTIALQEVLEQPIKLKGKVDWKNNAASMNFWIDHNGNEENILKGQGGSVVNILSVGLRMFALTTLDKKKHRRFLVLDEQDCWLHPSLVPRLVKIVQEAGEALGFQILMISHHDERGFREYADKMYKVVPKGKAGVEVECIFEKKLDEE